ncbi:COG4223 family protein [Pseudooceanicola sp. LIPI14-2-Ac024]|uniref:COG4223 family protein n=1 Tax=Pseudooceanicola sp. LIPI14-2-Ac024 TaxID=3344875 RepID=UPI0035CF8CD9
MAEKKSSSGKAKNDVTEPAAGVDPVAAPEVAAEAAAPEMAPKVDLTAVEHDPRPEGFAFAAADVAGGAPAPHTVEHDPRGETTPPLAEEPVAPATASVPPPPPAAEVERSGGGFFPMFLGGILAAAIGFGAGYWLVRSNQQDNAAAQMDEFAQRISQQGATIEELRTEITGSQGASEVDSRIDEINAALQQAVSRLDAMSGDVEGINGRIAELEKRPVTENVSQEAIAAYETELERLRQAMQDQRGEVEALVDQARQMESDANATAEATMRRAALTRILSSLDSGAPYGAALADLQAAGQEVPEALAASAESGVPSMADLREAYPEAARTALDASRGASDNNSVGSFLRDQFGVRSLKPREGSDPDAILSRAEGALAAGRLSDALAELETLPDVSRAELAGWIEQARLRADALAAAEDVNARLSDS